MTVQSNSVGVDKGQFTYRVILVFYIFTAVALLLFSYFQDGILYNVGWSASEQQQVQRHDRPAAAVAVSFVDEAPLANVVATNERKRAQMGLEKTENGLENALQKRRELGDLIADPTVAHIAADHRLFRIGAESLDAEIGELLHAGATYNYEVSAAMRKTQQLTDGADARSLEIADPSR